MPTVNTLFADTPVTVFETMSRLARAHNAINLGQGFPDVDGPEDMRRLAADALISGPNQYPPMTGLLELREAVSAANERFYGLSYDPDTEILITSGATEALTDCLQALLNPGDEVILIEPLYDCYLPAVKRSGAVPKLVRVEPPYWTLSSVALEEAFSDKTKAILLNNPMNPTAKVFTAEELQSIADLAIKFDAFVIADEVYEHIVFDEAEHIPIASLPGMRDRTVRIGSAGKTFSLTGWKVGYVSGPVDLIRPITKAHQFVTFTTPPNLQKAVAFGLGKDDAYYLGLKAEMQAKRDLIVAGLTAMGLPPLNCQGTYFVTVDGRDLGATDVEIAQLLISEAGVATVPVSAFYSGDAPMSLIRFCFCKQDQVIEAALERLRDFVGGMP